MAIPGAHTVHSNEAVRLPGWVTIPTGAFRHVWGGLIWRVFVMSALKAWTAEEGGRIGFTDDGETWRFLPTPDVIRSYLRGIYFFRRGPHAGLHGWAVGFDGYLIKTTDGGETWAVCGPRHIYPPEDPDAPGKHVDLWGVYFVDELEGWVSGIRVLRHTTDGGQTWEDFIGQLPEDTEFYNVAPTHPTLGLPLVGTAEPGIVSRSVDGLVWPTLIIPKVDALLVDNLELWDVKFLENLVPASALGYMAGGQGNQRGGVWRSTDGGQSWVPEATNTLAPTLYGVAILAGERAIAVGYGGSVYLRGPVFSSPGGSPPPWVDIRDQIDPPLPTVRIPMLGAGSDNDSAVWIGGVMRHLYRSADQGATWESQGSRGEWRMRNIFFHTSTVGHVVAQIRTILYTVDGGKTFSEQHPPTVGQPNLNSISFRDQARGVAVGNAKAGQSPLILWHDATLLPENPWRDAVLLTAAVNVQLQSVCWAGFECWAVGTNGAVLRSVDGLGARFDVFPSPAGPSDLILQSIAYDGAASLYLVGSSVSTGLSYAFELRYPLLQWRDLSAGLAGAWREVVALDSDVFAVGSGASGSGEVHRFDVSRRTWSRAYPTSSQHVEALYSAALVGTGSLRALFVGGERGQILRYQNGAWADLKSHTNVVVMGMSFLDCATGFALGSQSLDAAGEGVGDSAVVGFYDTEGHPPDSLLGDAPLPNPSTWAQAPLAISATAIAMAATEAFTEDGDPTAQFEYEFVCEEDPQFSSDFQDSEVYVAQNIPPGSDLTFHNRARVLGGAATLQSSSLSASTPAAPDQTPPAPNPPVWEEEPVAVSDTEITMKAGVATDAAPPVEYYFAPLSGVGAIPSDWQTSRTFNVAGLLQDSDYPYHYKTRDQEHNESDWSPTITAHTDAEPDVDPPTPDPAQWLVAPVGISDSAMYMRAVEAFDPSGGVQYKFRNLTTVGHDSAWQVSSEFTDTGLGSLSNQSYETLYRDVFDNEGTPSIPLTGQTLGPPDTAAPLPNPSTWDEDPHELSSTVIAMSAALVTFEATLPVQWEFDVDGLPAPGQVGSGWITTRQWTVGGQTPGVPTTWKHRSRDNASPPNVGAWSSPKTVTPSVPDTSAPVPDPSEWEIEPFAIDDQSISMTIKVPTFEPSTPVGYYVQNLTTPGHDSGWQPSNTFVDQNLPADTNQDYQQKTRDALLHETAFSSVKSAMTNPPAGSGTKPTMAPITLIPEDNSAGAALMVWPNMISVRSAVDPRGLACEVTVEIDTDPSFQNAESFACARGSISLAQASTGFRKVAKHIHDRTPDSDYWLRFRAQTSAGVSYSQTLHVHTPPAGVSLQPVDLQFDSLRQRSATELWPYWRAEGHVGRRFAFRYEWATSPRFSRVLGRIGGFYDGPSTPYTDAHGVTTQPRAEMLWALNGLPTNTQIWVRLSIWNAGGFVQNVQSFTTEADVISSIPTWRVGTPDQKAPFDRWGWRPSDPRDNNSPLVGPYTPTVFGCLSYNGDHTHEATSGHGLEEKDYTIYVDHLGYSKQWIPVGSPGRFTSSTDSAGAGGSGTSNIAKAVSALRGIGGIVRVARDGGTLYQAGDYGGQPDSSAPNPSSEAWWDNGLTGGSKRYFPLTGVRIQGADYLNMPRIAGTIGIQATHGSVNGLHWKGCVLFNLTHNSETVFLPGPSTNAGGLVGFIDCSFDVDHSFTTGFPGYGVLWHIKATSTYAVEIRGCSFSPAKEHSAYMNSLGMLGGVDSFFTDNWVSTYIGPNQDGWARANGRTMFQSDSRGDVIAAGNQLGTQTGLAPGRGTLWFIGNAPCNGSGLGGGSGGKGLSIPGHCGKVFVDEHVHAPDPDGNDYGMLNAVEDRSKGCWGNENGFAVTEVELARVGWAVTNTIANMVIINSTETFRITKRPTAGLFDSVTKRWKLAPISPVVPFIMNNRVAIMLSETTSGPPWPQSVGMVEMSFEGTAPNALRLSPCWPSNLSADKKVKYQSGGNINGTVPFDNTPAGIDNFNTLQVGWVAEAAI